MVKMSNINVKEAEKQRQLIRQTSERGRQFVFPQYEKRKTITYVRTGKICGKGNRGIQ